MIGNSDDETNFPHKSLLTDAQYSQICKAFENGSSANINFSKTQFSKTMQSGGIAGDLIRVMLLIGKEYYISKGKNEYQIVNLHLNEHLHQVKSQEQH